MSTLYKRTTRSSDNENAATKIAAKNIGASNANAQRTRPRGLRDITNVSENQTGDNTAGLAKAARKVTRTGASASVSGNQTISTANSAPPPPESRSQQTSHDSPVSEKSMEMEPMSGRASIGSDRRISAGRRMDIEEVQSPVVLQGILVDIDKDDLGDADSEARYIVDIHNNLREREARWVVDPTYFKNQTQINERMREILVDWLVEVHLKFKCVTETLFLTVALLDRYLEIAPTEKSQLQLVGVTAFLIASKYEEMYPPELSDLVFITDRTYTRAQLLAMEQTMLATLQFNLTMPSIEVFRVRCVKAALAGGESLPERDEQRQLNYLSAYYTQLCLQKSRFLRFLPSTLGAAAVWLARRTLGMAPCWHVTLAHYSSYSESDLLACARELAACVEAAPHSTEQRAVLKKFSHSRYLSVGALPSPIPP